MINDLFIIYLLNGRELISLNVANNLDYNGKYIWFYIKDSVSTEVLSGHLTVVAISETACRLTYNYDLSRQFMMTFTINTLR